MERLADLGERRIVLQLREALSSGRFPHAVLLAGASGTGKTTLARAAANALTCMSPREGSPCGTCSACRLLMGGSSPEIGYISPNEKGAIPIEAVRDAIEELHIKPAYGAHRVCIVDDCDAMTAQAQNAFLKTLEEPPELGILILTASHPEDLLGTVISRVERFDIDRPSEEEAGEYIRTHYPEMSDQEHFIYRYTGGSIGAIEKLCGDEDFMPLREECLARFTAMLTDKPDAAFSFAVWLEQNERRADDITHILMTFYSDLLMMQSGFMMRVTNRDCVSRLSELLPLADAETCCRGTAAIAAFGRRRGASVNLRMCCETLGLDLTAAGREV